MHLPDGPARSKASSLHHDIVPGEQETPAEVYVPTKKPKSEGSSSGSSSSGFIGDVGDFFENSGKYFAHMNFEDELDKAINESTR